MARRFDRATNRWLPMTAVAVAPSGNEIPDRGDGNGIGGGRRVLVARDTNTTRRLQCVITTAWWPARGWSSPEEALGSPAPWRQGAGEAEARCSRPSSRPCRPRARACRRAAAGSEYAWAFLRFGHCRRPGTLTGRGSIRRAAVPAVHQCPFMSGMAAANDNNRFDFKSRPATQDGFCRRG